ncbi:MAG: hypothetical protein IPK00_06670 [Deltaproteobacteria bacterium]|nr:hypothetical protein [Deltaproteobacteria bacterium]
MTTRPNAPRTPADPKTQPIGPVMLHIGTDVDEAIAAEFDRWCEDHVEDNLRLPGFVSARRLKRSPGHAAPGPSPDSLTLYQLESVAALETPEYKSRQVSMPASFAGRVRFKRSLYRELDVPPACARSRRARRCSTSRSTSPSPSGEDASSTGT